MKFILSSNSNQPTLRHPQFFFSGKRITFLLHPAVRARTIPCLGGFNANPSNNLSLRIEPCLKTVFFSSNPSPVPAEIPPPTVRKSSAQISISRNINGRNWKFVTVYIFAHFFYQIFPFQNPTPNRLKIAEVLRAQKQEVCHFKKICVPPVCALCLSFSAGKIERGEIVRNRTTEWVEKNARRDLVRQQEYCNHC